MKSELAVNKFRERVNESFDLPNCDNLFDKLYPGIKRLASVELMKLNPGKQLTPTILVNECYLKLRSKHPKAFKNQLHFYNTVAKCMRYFLVDLVRSHHRLKRKGECTSLGISQIVGDSDIALNLLELDDALIQLENIDADLANITTMRYFSGMTLAEIAQIYKCSKSHVHKQWTIARSLLLNLLEGTS